MVKIFANQRTELGRKYVNVFSSAQTFKTKLVQGDFLQLKPIKFLSFWFVMFYTQREQKCQDVSFCGCFPPQISFIFHHIYAFLSTQWLKEVHTFRLIIYLFWSSIRWNCYVTLQLKVVFIALHSAIFILHNLFYGHLDTVN